MSVIFFTLYYLALCRRADESKIGKNLHGPVLNWLFTLTGKYTNFKRRTIVRVKVLYKKSTPITKLKITGLW